MPPINIEPYTEPERKPLDQIIKNKKLFSGRVKNEIITKPTMPDAQRWLNTDKKLKEEIEAKNKKKPERHVIATFGRFNPCHIGHEALVHHMIQAARDDKKGADVEVHLSKSEDKKKNPLPYSQKFQLAQKAFGEHIVKHEPKVRNAFDLAHHLYNKGYTHLTLVAGPENKKDFNYIIKYNDNKDNPDRKIQFKKIEFMEVPRMHSSTEMRMHARNNDLDKFSKGLPTKLRADASEVMEHVRRGMKINEAFEEMLKLPDLSDKVLFNILESRMDTMRSVLTEKAKNNLAEKAKEHNIELNRLFEVYEDGCDEWIDAGSTLSQEQFAFIRVNQFITEVNAIKYRGKVFIGTNNEQHADIGKRTLGDKLYIQKKHTYVNDPDPSVIIHGGIGKDGKFYPIFEDKINKSFKKKIKKLEPALPGTKSGVGNIQSPLGIDAYIGEEQKIHKNKCPNCHDERECKCSNGSNHMGAFCPICQAKFTKKLDEAFERKGTGTGNTRQARWDNMTKDWVKCEHKCPHCLGTNYNAKKKGTVAKTGTWTHKVPPLPYKCKVPAISDIGCVNCTQYPLKDIDEELLNEGWRFFRKIRLGPVQLDISKHGIGATIGTKHVHLTKHLIGGGRKNKRTRLTITGPRLPLVGRPEYVKTWGKKKVNEAFAEKVVKKFPKEMFDGKVDIVPRTKKFMGTFKEHVINETGGSGGWGTNLLAQMYEKDTPGQKVKASGIKTPDIIETKKKRISVNNAKSRVTNSDALKESFNKVVEDIFIGNTGSPNKTGDVPNQTQDKAPKKYGNKDSGKKKNIVVTNPTIPNNTKGWA